jgi:hypothetical protein
MKDNYLSTARPLKEQIGLKTQQEKLDCLEVSRLVEMQEDILLPKKNQSKSKLSSSLVASLLVVVMLAAFIWTEGGNHSIQAIAGEVAGNHIKQRPMELYAQSMDQVQNYFKELDFSPANSDQLLEQFSLAESDLVGARYCSIKGITAAQLRYKVSTGHHSTLYEVGYDADIYGQIPDIDLGEVPETLMIKGLKVSIWVEKGLLMALVEDM